LPIAVTATAEFRMKKRAQRTTNRSDKIGRYLNERNRRLRVDLSRVPEWQRELSAIRSRFARFDLAAVRAAATCMHRLRRALQVAPSYSLDEERAALDRWMAGISPEKLVHLTNDYGAPTFVRSGDLPRVEDINRRLQEATERLSSLLEHGVTRSWLMSLFTRKSYFDDVRPWAEAKGTYEALANEIPRIRRDVDLIQLILSESRAWSGRAREIEKSLALATKKKSAIEKFEETHGHALAKAASVDGRTRAHANRHRKVVSKTHSCPYCGDLLGEEPHLDHIYPVSKGGLSILENLVWCCADCNILKCDKGLMEFLAENEFDVNAAIARLHKLRKHV
jgi:HNH endonuclease